MAIKEQYLLKVQLQSMWYEQSYPVNVYVWYNYLTAFQHVNFVSDLRL